MYFREEVNLKAKGANGGEKEAGRKALLMRQLAKLYLHLLPKALALMPKTLRQAQENSDLIQKYIGDLAKQVISEGKALCLKICTRARRSGRPGKSLFARQEDFLLPRTAIPAFVAFQDKLRWGLASRPPSTS